MGASHSRGDPFQVIADLGKRLGEDLQPVQKFPELRSINGFGARLYGRSDYDAVTDSHVTTCWGTCAYLPVYAYGRYRVVRESGRRYKFLGELPLRRRDYLIAAIPWLVLSAFGILLLVSAIQVGSL